jgi:hypothetical protein
MSTGSRARQRNSRHKFVSLQDDFLSFSARQANVVNGEVGSSAENCVALCILAEELDDALAWQCVTPNLAAQLDGEAREEGEAREAVFDVDSASAGAGAFATTAPVVYGLASDAQETRRQTGDGNDSGLRDGGGRGEILVVEGEVRQLLLDSLMSSFRGLRSVFLCHDAVRGRRLSL